MGIPAKFVAVLVAVSVMIVLITPAPDELPCTVGHKLAPLQALLAMATADLLQPITVIHRDVPAANRFFGVADVLSLSCSLLC